MNNGPICYTPDGCPLLGRLDHLPGLWLATGFCIGTGTGGGSVEYRAQWIVDRSRFSNNRAKQDVVDAIVPTYARGYTNLGKKLIRSF